MMQLPKPYYDDGNVSVYHGDALACLSTLPAESVQCCVTSPPYWGLRDYKIDGQLGLEASPELYVAAMVVVFREVRRVLRKDGTLWLNLGDNYARAGGWSNNNGLDGVATRQESSRAMSNIASDGGASQKLAQGLQSKNLVGIPWRVAFALQADGWYLRSDIIWAKPNPMPESVTDRPTKAHEYIFLMSKSQSYYYDAEAIKEDGALLSIPKMQTRPAFNDVIPEQRGFDRKSTGVDKQRGHGRRHAGFNERWDLMTKEEQCNLKVNRRSVWTIATMPYADAHFATFPPKLIEPCILAGSKSGDTILDPFHGAGTTALVSKGFNRKYIGIELNADYIEMSLKRLAQEVLGL